MNDTKPGTHLAPTDVLHGQKVRLRPPRVDELSFIRTLWGDPETMAPVGGPVDFPETRARQWFARMVEPGGPSNCYCLILNQDDMPVGEISFHQWDPQERSARLNVKILAAHRGRGYARDAVRTFLACFFGRIGGRLLTDDLAVANRAGQQLLASIGFARDDSIQDACSMAMTRRMYLKQYGEPDQTLEDTRA
ncbi:MAG TPA: GNAT family N-acetyltransferase [Phycisphaerae bacterium]|nr:GNAT family N-acetyltransferase [Phycisphaerae bacterium]